MAVAISIALAINRLSSRAPQQQRAIDPRGDLRHSVLAPKVAVRREQRFNIGGDHPPGGFFGLKSVVEHSVFVYPLQIDDFNGIPANVIQDRPLFLQGNLAIERLFSGHPAPRWNEAQPQHGAVFSHCEFLLELVIALGYNGTEDRSEGL